MAPARLEGHWFELSLRLVRLVKTVERSIEDEDTPTGSGNELDAQLQQRRVGAQLTELRILLEFAHVVHRLQRDLPLRTFGNRRLVLQSGDPLFVQRRRVS